MKKSAVLLLAALAVQLVTMPSVAQPAPALTAVRDSTLEALTGRQVEVTVASGLSAAGELAGFDDDTVTIIRSDSKVAVIPRGEIAGVQVVVPAPAPAPAPVAPAPPATTDQPGAAASTSDAGTEAAEQASWFPLPEVHIPQPWSPGLRSTNDELSDYERDLHVLSGATTDFCINGIDDPKCKKVLVMGAERTRSIEITKGALGIGMSAVGLVGLGLGAWRLDIGVAQSKIPDCETAPIAGIDPCAQVDDAKSGQGLNLALGGIGVAMGSALMIVGGVMAAVHFSRAGDASDYKLQKLSLRPMVAPGSGGLAVRGAF